MVALPAATAVTRPDEETVATPGWLVLQVIVRPVRVLLLASRVVAESCVVPPTCKLAVAGLTETEATGTGDGAATLSELDPVFPSLVAEIVAVPLASALTSPVAEIVATFEFELDQLIVRPTITVPVESSSVALACAVWPIATADGFTDTVTVAIGVGGGGVTAIVACPLIPSLSALTTAVPGATAETIPESLTLAMDALDENQLIRRPVSGVPFASFTTALARALCPAISVRGTVTETDATFAGSFEVSTTEVPYEEQAATAIAMPVTVSMKARMDMRPPLKRDSAARLAWRARNAL